jgi:hypothetical protein
MSRRRVWKGHVFRFKSEGHRGIDFFYHAACFSPKLTEEQIHEIIKKMHMKLVEFIDQELKKELKEERAISASIKPH